LRLGAEARDVSVFLMKLSDLRGFAFDLDGCIWAGSILLPGAKEVVAALRQRGKRVLFLTNNSRALPDGLAAKLVALGIDAGAHEVLAALELLGQAITRRFGRTTVLVVGTEEVARAVAAHGHTVVPVERWKEARVVAVGNDPTFDYARLKAASQAVFRGAAFVAVNLDPRLPLEEGEFDPGAGSLAEAIAVASGVRPIVVGKPNAPIFRTALDRLGAGPGEAAMIGDSLASDIQGGLAAGMVTVWVAPPEARGDAAIRPHLSVTSLHELLERLDDELP
jgi:HAD superfamily hydrolase (TIGR01450 family)